MLVTSVFAFCAGIYLQTLQPLSLSSLFLVALSLIGGSIVAVLRFPKISPVFITAAFVAIGAMRLAFVIPDQTPPAYGGAQSIFVGSVVEASPRVKVLSLSRPEELLGMRVVLLSGVEMEVSQEVRLFGILGDLNPTFNNPGAQSWKWLKKMEGVSYEIKGATILSVKAGKSPVNRMRGYFKRNIEDSGALHTDILKALTIGDRSAIPSMKNDLFMRTGTSHILAISGFNVGIVSGFFFFVVRAIIRRIKRFRLSGQDSRYASLFVIPFPFVFMLIAGAGVSVIRATIMTIVFMAALFLEREKDFYRTSALAALVILLIYPHSLFTPSFQLTFASLLFIVMFMTKSVPVVNRIKSKLLSWTVSAMLSTAAATLGTAPIVLYYFCGINPFCIVHNLITVPLLGVGATVSALIGMAFPQGHYLLTAAGYLADINVRFLTLMDFGFLYPCLRPTFVEMVLYYGLIIMLLHLDRKPAVFFLFLVLVPFSLLQAYGDFRDRYNSDLRIQFIDVGMGDATLIEAPGGVRILIDAGGLPGPDFDIGKKVITPFLLYRKVGRLDYVINTHPHGDHIGGLSQILADFRVTRLVTSGFFPAEKAFLDLIDLAKARRVEHVIWKEGDQLTTGGLRMSVLHPPTGSVTDNLNNSSLVLYIRFGNTTVLLPGDIDAKIGKDLVLSGLPLRSDVLKIPHHGSAASNSPAFVCAVDPRLAILSTGGRLKGLPSAETLLTFKRLGVPVLRTDKHGLIEVRSDGRTTTWKTYQRE